MGWAVLIESWYTDMPPCARVRSSIIAVSDETVAMHCLTPSACHMREYMGAEGHYCNLYKGMRMHRS